ncbi:PREDICTED: uncharacterized protein LOC104757632 [Camelina sativa]|uniref:Uncharacterized protein LOC104757632 n=1 Tax=Camelina sativa TaxID=90675 RepID=A0ABM0X070_CAMSA|nr:PREDICTED: uncharacterized protein LOC104757632 [Camelina sativa]
MSSSNVEQHVVHHNTHTHPLTKVDTYGDFTCGGCKTYGSGKTYRCVLCDYDLHDHCATCPSTLLTFMHPQHELKLVVNGAEHMCDICHGLVEGLYYSCEACCIKFHPLCTQQRQFLRYVPHSAHLLELSQCGASNTCMVCRGAILSWRYKCDLCMLDVHVECVNSSTPAVTETQMDLHTLQYPQPYNDESEYKHSYEQTKKGPSKRKRVFRFLKDFTVEVVCTIISEMEAELAL